MTLLLLLTLIISLLLMQRGSCVQGLVFYLLFGHRMATLSWLTTLIMPRRHIAGCVFVYPAICLGAAMMCVLLVVVSFATAFPVVLILGCVHGVGTALWFIVCLIMVCLIPFCPLMVNCVSCVFCLIAVLDYVFFAVSLLLLFLT